MSVYGFDEIHNKKRVIPYDDLIVLDGTIDDVGANYGTDSVSFTFSELGLNENDSVIVLSAMTKNTSNQWISAWHSEVNGVYPKVIINHNSSYKYRCVYVYVCNPERTVQSVPYRVLLLKVTDMVLDDTN